MIWIGWAIIGMDILKENQVLKFNRGPVLPPHAWVINRK